jgi:surface protein
MGGAPPSWEGFVTRWSISSEYRRNRLPLVPSGDYDFYVDWGDGTSNHVTNSWLTDGGETHDYSSPGFYLVTITGKIQGWSYYGRKDCRPDDGEYYDGPTCEPWPELTSLREVLHWGPLGFGDTEGQFSHVSLLDITAEDAPDLSQTRSLGAAFENSRALGAPAMHLWDVSQIENMALMFSNAGLFNGDIRNWDVSRVTDMGAMFLGAASFNQDLSAWDVSGVTRMRHPRGGMFEDATAFNGDLSGWDVSHVTDMSRMFMKATSFKQDLSTWNVSNVSTVADMFRGAKSFNGDVSTWDTRNFQDISSMFRDTPFNRDLGGWDTSHVESMAGLFLNATKFNQDIGNWDTSQVTNMHSMFAGAVKFDRDISRWNTLHVEDMGAMFVSAASFDQDLSSWSIAAVSTFAEMFDGASLSPENYDALLISWSQKATATEQNFDGGSSKYSAAAVEARRHLVEDLGWVISDGGPL